MGINAGLSWHKAAREGWEVGEMQHLSNNRADAKLQEAVARYERKLAMLRAKQYTCSFCDTMKARIAEGRTNDGEMIAYIDQHGRWDYSRELGGRQ